MTEAADDMAEMEADEVEGVDFDPVPFVAMGDMSTHCALANVLMVDGGITGRGQSLPAAVFAHRIADSQTDGYSRYLDRIMTNEQAGVYIERSSVLSGSVGETAVTVFDGIGLAGLSKLVRSIRNKMPDAQVRCVVDADSESSWNHLHDIVHKLTLVSIGKDKVVAHNPARYAGPNRVYDRTKFMQLWTHVAQRGYLAVTNPAP